MSVNRIVRRSLVRSLQAQRAYHKKRFVPFFSDGEKHLRHSTVWIDLRPRDKFGFLEGHCSQVAKKKRDAEETKRRLFGDRVQPVEDSQ